MNNAISEKWAEWATLLAFIVALAVGVTVHALIAIAIGGGLVTYFIKKSRLEFIRKNPESASGYKRNWRDHLVSGILFTLLFISVAILWLAYLGRQSNTDTTAATVSTSVEVAPSSYEDSKGGVWSVGPSLSSGDLVLISPSGLVTVTINPNCKTFVVLNLGGENPQTEVGTWSSNSQGWNLKDSEGKVRFSFIDSKPPFNTNCPID